MRKNIPRILTLPTLLATLTAAALATAAGAQSGKSGSSSAGQYRSHGQYRSGGSVPRPRPYINRDLSKSPWNPSFHHQNKFFQVTPRSFTGHLPHTGLQHRGGLFYNLVTPVPALPGYGDSYPIGEEAPPPPPAPAPQVYIIQPPPPPAPPPAVPAEAYEPPPPPPPRAPVSKEPGELALAVHPADARILINDVFVGTGESLAAKGEPLVMKPGVYVLEAEHPNHKGQRLVFAVTPRDTARVVIDLTAELPGRRARVANGDEDFLLN